MTTPNLGLIELTNSQGQYLNANETFAMLDALVLKAVIDKDLNNPPVSPSDGNVYIVGPSPTGLWSGQAGKIAFWSADAGEWVFITPKEGLLVHVNDEDFYYKYTGSAWFLYSGIPVQFGGSTIVSSPTALNFTGSGVSVSNVSGVATVNVTGGGGSSLESFRNRLMNGNFLVNQTNLSGSVVLAAGDYGHDGWKGGASGCTYTFASSGGVTTLTISAGSLVQAIDGRNLQSGSHVLSWSGTAQGKINAGSFSSSGVSASLTGGSNATVEFNTGTLSLVQLEPGSTANAFEYRPFAVELEICYWYRYVIDAANTTGTFTSFAFGEVSLTNSLIAGIEFPTAMRATPSVSNSTASGFAVVEAGTLYTVNSMAFDNLSAKRARVVATVSGTPLTLGRAGRLIANNNNTARLIFNAGL